MKTPREQLRHLLKDRPILSGYTSAVVTLLLILEILEACKQ